MATLPRIAIIGGGPGGLMLARLLQVRGAPATVLERDPHSAYRPQGGSLDLHVETGQRALRLGGLEAAFHAHARPEDQGDRLYDPSGTLLFDYDGEGFERPEIDRTDLRAILLDSLDEGTVRWGARVREVRPRPDGTCDVVTEDGADVYDIVVGADGAWSRVRPLLSNALPLYEGVVFVELGFEAQTHPFVAELAGSGKMFAVGDNRALVAQRNGHGHIRGYAGWCLPEAAAQTLVHQSPEQVRAAMLEVFDGWAPKLTDMVRQGTLLGVRLLSALPIGHSWTSRAGLTLLGDAAHLMSPFAGEGVNLALADAADLAEALTSGQGWAAVAHAEAMIAARAKVAAEDSAAGLRSVFSPEGVAPVLQHYRERLAG
ncbi:FAD-dependent oxidoreductase [Roseixanthobacter glucoisosaccharinicivorans]|uniref:FAD-dependent oxidoreductase n=1 Tax=Roseixanthobacter glucoisosaccharinicivorans TaxID=3119923 RepID=UPI00372803A4